MIKSKSFRHNIIIKTLKLTPGINNNTSPLTMTLAKYFQPKLDHPPEVPQVMLALVASAVSFHNTPFIMF